jgi:predicted transcriptional regulator of viral defense system
VNVDTHATQVLRLAEAHGSVRSSDVTERQIPRAILMRLVRAGRLKQVARGLYALPDQHLSRQHALAEVAARSSRGVFCLLTALQFHRVKVSSSDEIWLAIPNKARAPSSDHPPLRVVRFSGPALTEGVEQHEVDGVTVRVYSVAKSVADCFKFRSRIGLDAAIAALQKSRRKELVTLQDLQHYAQVCHVTEVMRPYLER